MDIKHQITLADGSAFKVCRATHYEGDFATYRSCGSGVVVNVHHHDGDEQSSVFAMAHFREGAVVGGLSTHDDGTVVLTLIEDGLEVSLFMPPDVAAAVASLPWRS